MIERFFSRSIRSHLSEIAFWSGVIAVVTVSSYVFIASLGTFISLKSSESRTQAKEVSPVSDLKGEVKSAAAQEDQQTLESRVTQMEQQISHILNNYVENYVDLNSYVPISGKNLIRNSSFESMTGSTPRQWNYTLDAIEDTTHTSREGIRSGRYGLKFKGYTSSSGKGLDLGIAQPLTQTVPQRTYTLSFFIKLVNVGPGTTVRLGFWDQYNNKYAVMKEHTLTSTKDWYRIYTVVTTKGTINDWANWYPMIELRNHSTGAVYVDDVQLEESSVLTEYDSSVAGGYSNSFIGGLGDGAILASTDGNIYPAESGIGSLGAEGHRWNELFLSNATIDKDGTMSLNGSATIAGNLTVGNTSTFNSLSEFVYGITVGSDGQLSINTTGNITKINGVSYSWPTSQAAASGYVLTNDGNGTLTWAAQSGGGAGNFDGSGGANYIARFSDADTLTTGILYDTGTYVGVGTTNPLYKLDVNGSIGIGGTQALAADYASSSMFIGNGGQSIGAGNGDGSLSVGFGSLFSANSSSYRNTAVGYNALNANTAGGENVAVGWRALLQNTIGMGNVGVGPLALRLNSGDYNTAVGRYAMENNISGSWNTVLGGEALSAFDTGSYNTALGGLALYTAKGSNNIGIGYGSGFNLERGDNNIIIGNNAGFGADDYNDAANNTIIGYQAGYNIGTSDVGNVYLGYQAGYNETGSNKLYIENSNAGPNTALIYGDFSTDQLTFNGSVGIGRTNPVYKLDVNGDIRIVSGSDLYIGSIGLNDTSSGTSGAELIGVYRGGFSNLSTLGAGDLQTILDEIDTQLGAAGSGTITAVGNITSGGAFTAATPGSNLYVGNTGWIGLGPADGKMVFNNLATDQVTFLGTNVGIGTTSPSALLSIGTGNQLTVDSSGNFSTSGTILGASINTGNGAFEIQYASTANVGMASFNSSYFTVNGSGQVSLASGGITGTELLDTGVTAGTYGSSTQIPVLIVDADGRLTSVTTASISYENPLTFGNGLTRTGDSIVLGGGLTADTRINIGATEVVYFDYETGRVGIGTTSLVYKLDINGDARVASGSDFYKGSIALGATGSSSTTSGASLIGVYSNLANSTGPNLTVQQALKDINDAVGGRDFTDGNLLVDNQTVTAALNTLNLAVGTTAYSSTNYVTTGSNLATAIGVLDSQMYNLSIGASGVWRDTTPGTAGGVTYLGDLTSNLAIGGSTSSAPIYLSPTAGLDINIASSTAFSVGDTANNLLTINTTLGSTTDLMSLYLPANSSIENIFAIYDNGSPIFKVSQTGIESAVPHSFTAAGDVSISYDQIFTNQTSALLESYGPLTIASGEVFENLDLTLRTYGTGDLILDLGSSGNFLSNGGGIIGRTYAGLGITAPSNGLIVEGRLGIGTTNPSNLLTLFTDATDEGITITDGTGPIVRISQELDGGRITMWDGGATEVNISTRNDQHTYFAGGSNFGINTTAPGSKLSIGGLGSSTGTALVIDANGDVWRDSSSLRYKENVNPFVASWDKIYDLQPVKYKFKGTDTYTIGYVAEDLHARGLYDLVVYDNDRRPDAIKYDRLSIYMLEALKDQNNKVKNLSESFNLEQAKTGDAVSMMSFIKSHDDVLETMEEQIGDLFVKVDENKKEADAKMDDLTKRIATLEATLFSKESTTSGILSSASGDVLGLSNQKIETEDLIVTGKTNLFDVGIVGNLTVGQLSIDGKDAEIDSLATPLELQSNGLADVRIMGGKVIIDTDGDVTIKEEVTAKKYNVDTTEKESASAGKAIIKAGLKKVKIETTSLTKSSLIFATPKSVPISVATEITSPSSFEIVLEKAIEEDLEVNWWLVN